MNRKVDASYQRQVRACLHCQAQWHGLGLRAVPPFLAQRHAQ